MKEIDGERTNFDHEKGTVCVLDASSYVGFWILKGLLSRGYTVHAALQKNGGKEIEKKIREMERVEKERLVVYAVDVFDYHSILVALKGCCALFCCLDCTEGYDDKMVVDLEVRGAINVVEACAQTDGIEKIVFSSSLTAAVWRENISLENDVDERSWSDQEFCRKMKLWYALAKTLSEQASWALAMDRMLNMVSINAGLVLGPSVAQQNPGLTISYLKGADKMYENGVLAFVDVNFLADVHIRAFEDHSTCGRYFCFNQIVNTEGESVKLAQSLSPLISMPPRIPSSGISGDGIANSLMHYLLSTLERCGKKEGKSMDRPHRLHSIRFPSSLIQYACQGSEVHVEKLRNNKLNKLVEDIAY